MYALELEKLSRGRAKRYDVEARLDQAIEDMHEMEKQVEVSKNEVKYWKDECRKWKRVSHCADRARAGDVALVHHLRGQNDQLMGYIQRLSEKLVDGVVLNVAAVCSSPPAYPTASDNGLVKVHLSPGKDTNRPDLVAAAPENTEDKHATN